MLNNVYYIQSLSSYLAYMTTDAQHYAYIDRYCSTLNKWYRKYIKVLYKCVNVNSTEIEW